MSQVSIGDQKFAAFFDSPQGWKIQLLDSNRNIIFEDNVNGLEHIVNSAVSHRPGKPDSNRLRAELILILAELTPENIHPDSVYAAKMAKSKMPVQYKDGAKHQGKPTLTIEADTERGFKLINADEFDPLHHVLIKDEALSTVLSTAEGK